MQANTVPAAFWALAFLLLPEHQHYKQQVLASCQQFHFQSNQATTAAAIAHSSATDRPSAPAQPGITDRPLAQPSSSPSQHGTRYILSIGQRASDMPSTQSSSLPTEQGASSGSTAEEGTQEQIALAQPNCPVVSSTQTRHRERLQPQESGCANVSTQPGQDPVGLDPSSISGKIQCAAGSSRRVATLGFVSRTPASSEQQLKLVNEQHC